MRDFERALEAARRADAALARGEATGPLHGLPITIKEAYGVAGLATTWGVPALAHNIAHADSVVESRLREAGAHFLGKSNVPFMLGDFQSSNELFGTTNNPWDTTRGPGGSSGGSAAALAAGLTTLEIGSDIGGSVRNPAHFCGVYGHKPTWGIVSMRGHELPSLPAGPDLAVAGPVARSAEDLAVALHLLAGADQLDAQGWRLELPPPRSASLRGLRIAVWPSDPLAPVDDEISDRIQRIADLLARRGATISDRARPAFDAADYRSSYVALVGAMMGASAPDAVFAEHEKRAPSMPTGPRSSSRGSSPRRPVASFRRRGSAICRSEVSCKAPHASIDRRSAHGGRAGGRPLSAPLRRYCGSWIGRAPPLAGAPMAQGDLQESQDPGDSAHANGALLAARRV